jgi:hypothetical protein
MHEIGVPLVLVYGFPAVIFAAALGAGFLAGRAVQSGHQVIDAGSWRAEYRRKGGTQDWHLETGLGEPKPGTAAPTSTEG